VSQTTKSKSSKSKSSGKHEPMLNPLLIQKQRYFHPFASQQTALDKWKDFAQDTWHIVYEVFIIVVEKVINFAASVLILFVSCLGHLNPCRIRATPDVKLQIVLDLDQTIIKTTEP
jgi:hypothetical protein